MSSFTQQISAYYLLGTILTVGGEQRTKENPFLYEVGPDIREKIKQRG